MNCTIFAQNAFLSKVYTKFVRHKLYLYIASLPHITTTTIFFWFSICFLFHPVMWGKSFTELRFFFYQWITQAFVDTFFLVCKNRESLKNRGVMVMWWHESHFISSTNSVTWIQESVRWSRLLILFDLMVGKGWKKTVG